MAITPQVAGACLVKIDAGAGLESAGYTANGADVRREAFFDNVPGDQNGGDRGPPIDVQYHGETATVRLELTSFDTAVTTKIEARLAAGTAGTPGTTGTLMFTGAKTMRLLLLTTTGPLNFPRAIPRGAIELNKGTRYSTFVCEFECHKDGTGVLYNASTS